MYLIKVGGSMKFLVVGAGGQGAPCAAMLSRDPEVSKTVLADINGVAYGSR